MSSNKKPAFSIDHLSGYLGGFWDDFDVDAIIDEATEIDPQTGNRFWTEYALEHLWDICTKHDKNN